MVYSFRNQIPRIDPSAFLVPSADVIGDVEIGSGSSLWFQTVVRGDVNAIRIGQDTNVQDGSILHVTYQKWPLHIGNSVSIGHSVTVHGCRISDFVLLGMGCTILDGAEIGSDCLIGANALVTEGMKVPPGSLVLGTPGKVVRPLRKEEIQMIHERAQYYKQYVQWYRDSHFPEASHIPEVNRHA